MANDLRYNIEIDGIARTITNLADLKKAIQDNNKVLADAKLGTDRFNNALMNMNGLKLMQKELTMTSQKLKHEFTGGLAGAQTASANASMALLNLNYVIRDSPYFFNNFALGLLAVGNNLNPLIDSFNRLRQEAVGKSISTFQLLKQALVGGAGISIAFSLVVTAIQSFVFWQSRAKDKTKEAKEELTDYIAKLQDLSTAYTEAQRLNFESMKQRYAPREGELQGYISQLTREQGAGKKMSFAGLPFGEPMQPIPDLLRKYREELKNIQDLIKAGDPSYKSYVSRLTEITVAANTGVGAIKSLNIPLVDLKQALTNFSKAFDEALPEDREAWRKRYNNLKEAIKQLDLLEDKLKKVKNQAIGWDSAYSRSEKSPGRPDIFARRGFYAGEETNKRFGMRQAERTKAFGFGGMVKELDTTLEMAKIGAQQLGDALEGAFSGAKIKLSDLINQITIAITKMLVLQGITSLFTGGLFGGGATSLTPSASGGGTEGMWITSGWGAIGKANSARFSGGGTNIRVMVDGKLRANSKEFVADFKNAEKQVGLMKI